MKKLKIISILLLFISVQLFANDKEEKNPADYLPKAGEISIGVDAKPVLNFVGNMFNGTLNQGLTNNDFAGEPYDLGTASTLYPSVSITGKYMFTDDIAFRANIGLISTKFNDLRYVQDDAALVADPLSKKEVIDNYMSKMSGASIALGAEYRLGKKRVQGVFSLSAHYAYSRRVDKYTYGNIMTDVNQTPTIADPSLYAGVYRPLKKFSNDPIHQYGLIGGVGIEWFFAKKISLGAEVNLALVRVVSPDTWATSEYYNAFSGKVETWTDTETPKQNGFFFGTENIGSNISFNFYF